MEVREPTVLRTPTRPMILGARRGEKADDVAAKLKESKVIVINTSGDKLKKKINKIETIKRRKIADNQKPSELLKYYDYLSYEYPKLLAKNLENKDGDLVSSIKKSFEDKPKDTNKAQVNTSSFVDVELADKLRRELIDTETKLDMDRRMREEMAKKDLASSKITEALRGSKRIKEGKAKADELRMEKEKAKATSLFKELDYPEAAKPKRASDKRTVDIGDGMTLTTKSARGRRPLVLPPPMFE